MFRNLLTPAGAALRSATFILRIYKAEDLPQSKRIVRLFNCFWYWRLQYIVDSSALQSMKKFIGMGDDDNNEQTLVDPYLVLK